MSQELAIKLAGLALSATPLSLIIIKIFLKIFEKNTLTLGKTSCICTGTHGILTKKTLKIKTIFFDNQKISIKEDTNLIQVENTETKEAFSIEKTSLQQNESIQLMAIVTHLCHYQKIKKFEKIIGKFLKECGLGKDRTENSYCVISEIPTNENKKISTVVAEKTQTQEIFAFTKGNAKNLLNNCTRILFEGKKIELTHQLKRKIRKRVEKMNKRGQKVIAFAYKGLPKKKFDHYSEQFTENDLVFIGMLGLNNPINKEIAEYIQKSKELGLKIYITSGIRERKVVALAKELNIVNENYFEAISGDYLKSLSDPKLEKMLSNKEKDFVFASLKKDDRLRIYETLKKIGETPAIASSNENSFKKINEAILSRKKIKANKQKILIHSVLCKIAETILFIIAISLSWPLPLSLAMIIAIELIVNLPLQFALHKGPISPGQKLHKKSFLITNILAFSIILSALYFFTIIRYGLSSSEIHFIQEKLISLMFFALIIIQIISAYQIRNINKSFFSISLFKNIYLILTTIISLLLIYAGINIFQIKNLLQITDISKVDWQLIAFSALSIFIIEEIRKLLTKLFHKKTKDNENSTTS